MLENQLFLSMFRLWTLLLVMKYYQKYVKICPKHSVPFHPPSPLLHTVKKIKLILVEAVS